MSPRVVDGPHGVDRRRLRAMGLRAVVIAAVLALLTWTSISIVGVTHSYVFLLDFKGDLYNAGLSILHGHDPYHPGFLARQAAIQLAGGASATTFAIPVYAAPALLAATPLSLLPFWLAGGLFTVLSIAAMISGLRLLGVRDLRCMAIALGSWPFLFGLYFGNLGPLIVLGAGIAWRWRERLWPPALALASIILAKLFPWPLAVWLLVTRRFRTLALTLAIGGAGVFVAWAAIGFAGMTEFPRMLYNLAVVEEGKGPSLVALLLAAGVPTGVAKILALAAAAALLGAAWRVVGGPDGERRAFGLTVVAALTASPIVWEHYLIILFIPIALMSPRLSAIWFVPVVTCLVPAPHPGSVLPMLFWIGLEALIVAWLSWTPSVSYSQSANVAARLRRAIEQPFVWPLPRDLEGSGG
jgi:hypothetical protein